MGGYNDNNDTNKCLSLAQLSPGLFEALDHSQFTPTNIPVLTFAFSYRHKYGLLGPCPAHPFSLFHTVYVCLT